MAPTGSDRAFLVWRVLLGLLVNLVLIAAVVTLVAAALSIYYRWQHPGLIRPPPANADFGASPNGSVWSGGLLLSALGLVLGCLSIMVRPQRRDEIRRFLEVWSLGIFVLGVLVVAL